MARRKGQKDEAVADGLDGTVEGLARDHWEREKAGYEARTGETVWFEPPVPVTRTPISRLDEAPADTDTGEETPEGEGDE